VGSVVHWLILSSVDWKWLQIVCGVAALMLIFSMSHLRVLTYSSFNGSGGTYTFWTAMERYFGK